MRYLHVRDFNKESEELTEETVTEEEKRAAAVELPSVGDSLYNKENIPHERIFADNQAYTENNFEEETITRPSLPVLPTVPTSPSYSDKNTPVFESPISGEAAMRPVSEPLQRSLIRVVVTTSCVCVLGRACRQHQDWFGDNDAAINALLTEKNQLHKAYIDRPTAANKTVFFRSRRLVQQRLREMQDAWMSRKAEEIQGYADRNELKNIFAATKAICGPPVKSAAPFLSADGSMLLTEKTQILTRWLEHFRSVLNQPSTISDGAIDRLSEVEITADLDLPPSLQETIRAVQQLSSGKAPGSNAIPDEIYKHGGPQLMNQLTVLFQEMRHEGQVPQDFKDAIIVHLYKKNGNRQVCNNHRGNSLLNITGKIIACILLNCLNAHLEQGRLPERQCGFRRHRGTIDMIFAARQLQE
ncbi:unnamed protein product [Schistocephalus solidus]|uniref:Reverse transcriptase domain-containing protein n=1 Tax=Schistocephalus solidus TaxID=70667 RepID=A0A183TIS1_SCHSO|nr:unnamed protein product [Schistocephalus solidus]